jgi:hypothetical protein
MNIVQSIKKSISDDENSIDIARKIFLSYQTQAFAGREDIEYSIKNSIKNHLKIPFTSIHVAGSAKSGFSFFNQTLFTEGESDLDVSIISLDLYNKLLEISHRETDGFTNLSVFPEYKGKLTDRQFLNGIKKGYFNPFFMPNCREKMEWLDFFRHLSNDYFKIFKRINAAVYASEYFFEYKQSECIDEFKDKVNLYDSLPSKIKRIN